MTIAALVASPVISYIPIFHLDMYHYDRTTDHTHIIPFLVKGLINIALLAGDRTKKLFSKRA
jgi:hypothetical protein